MRFFRVGLLFLLWGTGHSLAQEVDTAADKSKLIALENAWNQAQMHRDGKALNGLLADTFIYTHWDGTVMNKTKFMADIQEPSVKTSLVANDEIEVHFYPGVAIVAGAYHAKGSTQGKPFDHYGRFTDTWILSKDKWQCVASHTNLVKK
jgi:ketosteroid isomerase-like protein